MVDSMKKREEVEYSLFGALAGGCIALGCSCAGLGICSLLVGDVNALSILCVFIGGVSFGYCIDYFGKAV